MNVLVELNNELIEQVEFIDQLKEDIKSEFDLIKHFKLADRIIEEEKSLEEIRQDIAEYSINGYVRSKKEKDLLVREDVKKSCLLTNSIIPQLGAEYGTI